MNSRARFGDELCAGGDAPGPGGDDHRQADGHDDERDADEKQRQLCETCARLAADQAADHFARVHQQRKLPEDMPTRVLTGPTNVVDIIHDAEFAPSKSQARRLVQQGAVKLDGERIASIETDIESTGVLQVGKRRFLQLM